MIVQNSDLYRIMSAISKPCQIVAPIRSYCMNCQQTMAVRPTATSMSQLLLPSALLVSQTPLSTLESNATAAKWIHCRHCSRSVCTNCCKVYLPMDSFGTNFRTDSSTLKSLSVNGTPPLLWPCCVVCETILTSRKEILSFGTQPTTATTSYGGSATNGKNYIGGDGGSSSIHDFLFESSYENDDIDDHDTHRYSC